MTAVRLMARLARGALNLTDCISFRFEKDRFLPYTAVSGEWYCPRTAALGEIMSIMLYIDNVLVHSGYPTGATVMKKDGRTVLKVSSKGISALLEQNQCADGLVPDVDLAGLVAASGVTLPGITYQTGTPVVNYVNYYNGTSLWDGIVSYSRRAAKTYPYLYGPAQIRITPPEGAMPTELDGGDLIYRSNATDYSRIISSINMKPIDGEGEGYSYTNSVATRKGITRVREIPFDREWIMDPNEGLEARGDFSMRSINCDRFGFYGYKKVELLDGVTVPSEGFSGTVCGFKVEGSAGRVTTEIRCDHDKYSV